MRAGWDADRVVGNVALSVEKARAGNVPVIWVQHESEELVRGSLDWQWVPRLVPAAGETLIAKRFPSSFEDTGLEAELARLDASHIVLAGAQTNWCMRATAYAALDKGYDLTLVGDAHTTDSVDLGDGQTIEAQATVQDLNLVFQWLRYPGRACTTALVAELAFSRTSA
ncbi:MAG: isochorismatase family protein [Rubrivivax sp.]